MIDASSSIASGVLSSAFGTPAASAPSLVSGTATASTSTPAYILDGSLQGLGGASSFGSFLSNAIFAADTEALLRDPLANGKITGTPSANVQKLLSELDPAMPASANSTASNTTENSSSSGTTGTTTVSGLPTQGVLA